MDAGSRRHLVLLVEDDASAATRLAQLLREDGYAVEVVWDGESAIARLARAPAPDAVVVDWRLPRTDGIEVARHARALVPAARVVMITGWPEIVGARLRAAAETAVLLPKPIAYAELTKHLSGR